jgi:hypothetical protein
MSTHTTHCIVCAKDCYCCDDTHALSCGGSGNLSGCGGCDNPPYIEFCSEECFHELENRMKKSWYNYRDFLENGDGL